MYIRLIIAILLTFSSLFAKNVKLQLQWKHQYQFAGFYVAKEMGFYKDAGLDVDILEYQNGLNLSEMVTSNTVDFATGRPSLLLDKINSKKDILLLAAIFQTSPFVLHAKKRSDITSLQDIKNKKVMFIPDLALMASVNAMLYSQKIPQNSFVHIEHSFDYKDLINGKTDFMSSYISNEPFRLKENGYDSIIFNPKDYGYDFYGDILFTSKKLNTKQPKVVEAFHKASIKGWLYAFENIDKTVDIIINKYNSQHKSRRALLYEANELKKLAFKNGIEFGEINQYRLNEIVNTYKILGLIQPKVEVDLSDIIYTAPTNHSLILNQVEKQYLDKKQVITMCVDPNWMPYEKIENGKYIGIGSDYIKIFSEKLGIKFELIPTQSWEESKQKAKDRVCDILVLSSNNASRKEFMNITKPYLIEPLVIATKHDQVFLANLSEIKPTQIIGITKGYSLVDRLKKQYPNLTIKEVENTDTGLKLVADNELFGQIDAISTINYYLHENYQDNLKVSGKFQENYELGMAVRKDDQVLFNIFEKVIDSISKDDQQIIYTKWNILGNIEKQIDYILMIEITSVLMVVLLFFFYKNRQLIKAKQELQKSLDSFKMLLEATIDGLLISNGGIVIDVNKEAIKLFKYDSKDEMIGKSLFTFIVPESRKDIEDRLRTGSTEAYEIKCIRKNGEVFHALIKGKYLEYNNITVRATSIVDLSDLKDKEHIIMQQSKMVALGEMIGNIAHQWRQPLSIISTMASGMKLKNEFGKLEDDDIKYFADSIVSNTKFLSQTIDDFRDFIKGDKYAVEFDIKENISKNLSILNGMLKNYDINVILNIDDDIKIINYENELTQAFVNIINNSKDAFKENNIDDKFIFIDVKIQKDFLVLTIKDNAGGIPDNVLGRIFEPYFTTKHKSQGTGLGLFMTHKIIVESMKGSIEVSNVEVEYNDTKYQGACFTLQLPI